jgi:hypothetical protein
MSPYNTLADMDTDGGGTIGIDELTTFMKVKTK